ncbi:VWA domain-containing protein [Sessilibacter corallicola]|uniref:VWFA domain-containing protein n=1 Tax=Sessilibacter corallicola TaxID=2904075 RepID=A0ABQ0A6K6_9GAMM|nr:vWA domain-containing protein [Sessilibacter corallicola]MCE2028611.1 VWA domain-containing protein [Sessilibacter corallicola]
MARSRRFSTFSLSFLDIMSCGFGAVALIFLIIKHDVDNQIEDKNPELIAEVTLLEEEIKVGQENLVRAKNTVSDVDQQLAEARGLARRINEDINAVRGSIEQLNSDDPNSAIQSLKDKLKELEEEKKRIEEEAKQNANNVRRFVGQGNRQYLTGLNLGGQRVLILLDASASMLDETLINVIRRRNMDDATKRQSAKWQRSLAIVEWLIAQLPENGQYQIYAFNTDASSPLLGTEGDWLNVGDKAQLERAIDNLRQVVPKGGTNFYRTFSTAQLLNPTPDNIFLITDGLPTQGRKASRKNTVTGAERLNLYNESVELLPRGIPVNTILLPMEGDPFASSAFWRLAQISQGAFLTPSKDWP